MDDKTTWKKILAKLVFYKKNVKNKELGKSDFKKIKTVESITNRPPMQNILRGGGQGQEKTILKH